MSYASHSRMGRVIYDATAQAAIANQTPADKANIFVLGAITVLRIMALVTLAQTVTAAVVDFDVRITPGSDTGRVDKGLGTLTLPVAGAIGTIVYKNVRVDLNPGDQIVIELVTASTAGAALYAIEYVPRDFVPTDYTELVASA